jgi:hypothetical protein
MLWSPDSRYIAYYQGGNYFARPCVDGDRVQLMVYDVQTGQSYPVPSPQQDVEFAWTHRGSLLVIGLTPKPQRPTQKKPRRAEGKAPEFWRNPAIYEVPIRGGQPKLLIDNGRAPMAESPDGEWIAFYGSHDAVSERMLYLYNRQEKKRYPVPGARKIDYLYWTPNSQRVIVGRNRFFYIVDITTRKLEQLADLHPAGDTANLTRTGKPGYSPLSVSSDASFVYVKGAEFMEIVSLFAIDLNKGGAVELAQIKSSAGLDWITRQRP